MKKRIFLETQILRVSLLFLCLTLGHTHTFRLLASKKPTIYTKPNQVPAYIHKMIRKYRKSENNIFFILSPVNANHFHGDILHSSVNASAGGKNNTQVNVKTLNEKIEAKELTVILDNLKLLEGTVTKLERQQRHRVRAVTLRQQRRNKKYVGRKRFGRFRIFGRRGSLRRPLKRCHVGKKQVQPRTRNRKKYRRRYLGIKRRKRTPALLKKISPSS